MRDIMDALYEFWSQFGIPAYAEDMVPDTATVPYIRYTVSKGPAFDVSYLTAFNYHSRRLMGNAERAELSNRIADAIPEKGVKIPLDHGGFIVMYRNSDFQTPYQDPEDLDVIGIRTSVEIHFYAM
jgi:hypothetical protein